MNGKNVIDSSFSLAKARSLQAWADTHLLSGDTTKPVITVTGGTTTLVVGGTFVPPIVTAIDDVDGNITANIVVGGDTVDVGTAGVYTMTYDVADSSGNAATQATFTCVVSELVMGTVIQGLQAGDTVAVGRANSAILNSALSAGGTLDLIIPINTGVAPKDYLGNEMAGYWATYEKVNFLADTTVTFLGGLMQTVEPLVSPAEGAEVRGFDVSLGNVTLNNPRLSQGGYYRTERPGTHATLGIYGAYNTGNITINGGVIDGGGSNCFQGGRNNVVFNGTVFKGSREHLIYAHGINGDGTNTGASATGLHFNNCTMSNPGIVYKTAHEANHIQLRYYSDVTISGCTVNGRVMTPDGQYGLLCTDVHGLAVEDTVFSDCKHFAYIGAGCSNIRFTGVDSVAEDLGYVIRTSSPSLGASFVNCTFKKPYVIYGTNTFDRVRFDIGRYRMVLRADSNSVFHDTTWDIHDGTSTTVLEATAGAVYSFTGTTTRVCPSDARPVVWGPVPGSCP